MDTTSELPPTSFVELTIEAHEERRKRWDWDYVMCTVIRCWEAYLTQQCRKLGKKQPRGSMAWYHWHEICDRAFFRLTERLEEFRDAVAVGGALATDEEAQRLDGAGDTVLQVVGEECRLSWDTMYERLAQHEHRPPHLFTELQE